jgi:hypothetical protein
VSPSPHSRVSRRPVQLFVALLTCLLIATATPYTLSGAAFTDSTDNANNTWLAGEWATPTPIGVAITAPAADGAVVDGMVTLSAEVSGGAPDSVAFRLNGVQVCLAAPGGGAWSCQWDSTTVDNGGYDLTAVATAGGTPFTSAPRNITVSNTGPAAGAVTWHGTGQQTNAGSANIATVPPPDGVAPGDLILLLVSNQNDQEPSAPGFSLIRTENASPSRDPRVTALWKIAGSSEPTSYSISIGGDNWHVAAVRVTGHHPTTPIGNSTGTAGRDGSPVVIQGITTSANDVLLVAAVVNRANIAGYTAPTGMTQRYTRTGGSSGSSGSPSAAGATQIVAAQGPTGTRSYAWSSSDSDAERRAALMFEILPGGPPPAPSGLSATSGQAGKVPVSWNAVAGATAYDVRHRPVGTTAWGAVTGIAATNLDVIGLQADITYEFAVRSRNAFGAGPWSAAVTGTPTDPPPPPAAPTDLIATALGVDQMHLTWTDNADNETGFRIERAPAGTGAWTHVTDKPADSTAHTDTALTGGTAYDYRISAYNGGGWSAWATTSGATASCATLAPMTLTSVADSVIAQAAPGTNFGTSTTEFGVRSHDSNRNARSLVRFDAVPRPGGCPVTSATLRMHATSASSVTRTLEIMRVDASWEETTVTWGGQPAASGPVATTSSGAGWRTWDVTGVVGADGAGAPHGFLLRDAVESASTQRDNYFSPREGQDPPELVVGYE